MKQKNRLTKEQFNSIIAKIQTHGGKPDAIYFSEIGEVVYVGEKRLLNSKAKKFFSKKKFNAYK